MRKPSFNSKPTNFSKYHVGTVLAKSGTAHRTAERLVKDNHSFLDHSSMTPARADMHAGHGGFPKRVSFNMSRKERDRYEQET